MSLGPQLGGRLVGGSQSVALPTLAELFGVVASYTDPRGRTRNSPTRSVVQVLRLLGARVDDPERAVADERARRLSRILPPVWVARPERAASMQVTVPADQRDLDWTITREDGTVDERNVALGPALRYEEVQGQQFAVHALRVPALPLGRHTILAQRRSCTVLSAPARAPPVPRGWGVFLPLHALRTHRDVGVGGFNDLAALGRWAGLRGASFLATLPVLAGGGPTGDTANPYLPSTRRFHGDLHLDVEDVPGAREALARAPGLLRRLQGLRDGSIVDVAAIRSAKRQILRQAFHVCRRDRGPSWNAFLDVVGNDALLRQFARFQAERRRTASFGDDAPEPSADGRSGAADGGSGAADGRSGPVDGRPDPAALVARAIDDESAGAHAAAPRDSVADAEPDRVDAASAVDPEPHGPAWPAAPSPGGPVAPTDEAPAPDAQRDAGASMDDEALFEAFVEWCARQQLAAAADQLAQAHVKLVVDLPAGVDRNGFDAWHDAHVFASEATLGAPPDALVPRGLDWGSPPLHPRRSEEQGHAYIGQCMRHAAQQARIVRLNQVWTLHRTFWIPKGAAPADGVYVRMPAPTLYAALVLEATRAGSALVGEDVGTVAPAVRPMMRGTGVLRLHVLSSEATARRPLPTPARDGLACLATHETPTFAAFLAGDDLASWVHAGWVSEHDAAQRLHERQRLVAGLAAALRERQLLPGANHLAAHETAAHQRFPGHVLAAIAGIVPPGSAAANPGSPAVLPAAAALLPGSVRLAGDATNGADAAPSGAPSSPLTLPAINGQSLPGLPHYPPHDETNALRDALAMDRPDRANAADSLGDEAARELVAACLAFLASGPARLVQVNLEDLWLEPHAHDRPGLRDPAAFRRRAAMAFEEFEHDPFVLGALADVDRRRKATA